MIDLVQKLHVVIPVKMEKKTKKSWLCCQTIEMFILSQIKASWHM